MQNPGFKFEYFSKSVKYHGFNIETYAIGSGDKIVFSFPSFPHSGLYYLWFLTHYNLEKVKFITFDLPGWIGYSDNIFAQRGFNIDEFISVAKEVIRSYGLNKFSLLGYSFGTALAIRLNHDMPNRIEKIVLVSPVIDQNLFKNAFEVKIINFMKFFQLEDVLGYYLKNRWNYYRPIIATEGFPANFIAIYDSMISRADPKIVLESIFALFHNDWSKYLDSLMGKDLLIVNSRNESRLMRRQAEMLRRKFTDGKSVFFSGKHEDFILRPKSEVVKEVVRFLTS